MERIEKLKLILGIEGTEQDALLSYLLQSTERKILNYCNIEELPAELEDVLIEITADGYRSQQGVANISIGDTSVSFKIDTESFNKNHKAQLNRFRRLQLT